MIGVVITGNDGEVSEVSLTIKRPNTSDLLVRSVSLDNQLLDSTLWTSNDESDPGFFA